MSAERVVIAGSSGLIGSALKRSLRDDGISVVSLVRRAPRNDEEIEWAPDQLPLDPSVIAEATVVVNLCGASIGKLPWTSKYRKVLRESRLQPTRTLARAIHELGSTAPHFLSASASGFYGSQPGIDLTEDSSAGSSFLAQLCEEWEREALSAGPGARVAHIRTAPILHPDGVLKPLIALTKLGVSGPLGGGDQAWPWISLTDEVRAIRHIIDRNLSGPINLTGPETVSANETGKELAEQLRRPFVLPAPKWALRLGLGRDASDSLLLSDARIFPKVLTDSGFVFAHPSIREAIRSGLGH
ncbi:MAG: TIGR01777 family oxidoreductase [Leucobacter sp.]